MASEDAASDILLLILAVSDEKMAFAAPFHSIYIVFLFRLMAIIESHLVFLMSKNAISPQRFWIGNENDGSRKKKPPLKIRGRQNKKCQQLNEKKISLSVGFFLSVLLFKNNTLAMYKRISKKEDCKRSTQSENGKLTITFIWFGKRSVNGCRTFCGFGFCNDLVRSMHRVLQCACVWVNVVRPNSKPWQTSPPLATKGERRQHTETAKNSTNSGN